MPGTVKSRKIMIIAGEPSGDIHGADLIRAAKAKMPHAEFFGIGGESMKKEGAELFFPIEKMAILGFIEVIKHLPFIRKVFARMLKEVRDCKPDIIVLIDYPGFNIRFARKIKELYGSSIKVLYYISPQVWAWKKKRRYTIASVVDMMAVVFPFEVDVYKGTGLDVRFVGHPLVDNVIPQFSRDEFLEKYNLSGSGPVIGLLPGSRKQEIGRHLSIMSDSVNRLKNDFPGLKAVIAKIPFQPESLYRSCLDNDDVAFCDDAYSVMRYSTVLAVASGTATLESGLSGTPMVIMYRMSPISFRIARFVVKLPHVGLINIVHGKKVVPELIQDDANSDTVAKSLGQFLNDKELYSQTAEQLSTTSAILGDPGASERTADLLIELLQRPT